MAPPWIERFVGHAGRHAAVTDYGYRSCCSVAPAPWLPMAMPRAALIDVLECPAPKWSYSDSPILGNPDSPPLLSSDPAICSRLPVKILCG